MPAQRGTTGIALATSAEWPELTPDDRLAGQALRRSGVEEVAAVWSDPQVDWARFHGVVVRSCWDYHLRLDDFHAWLAELERLGVPTWNPIPTLRWNLHKSYLLELRQAGVRVVPTHLARRGSQPGLDALRRELGRQKLVAKPAVSTSARGTWCLEPGQDARSQARLERELSQADVLVQPLVEEVATRGEWSLIFIGGRFSHAVLKRARPGEFRVQAEWGGSAHAALPPAGLREEAERALVCAPSETLYARADLVETAEGPLLMELELVEPELFFRCDRESPDRFRRALAAPSYGARTRREKS